MHKEQPVKGAENTAAGSTTGSRESIYSQLEAVLENVHCTMGARGGTLYQPYLKETPKGLRKLTRKIGSIKLEDASHQCTFTKAFLREHPELADFRVFYASQGSFEFKERLDEEQALAVRKKKKTKAQAEAAAAAAAEEDQAAAAIQAQQAELQRLAEEAKRSAASIPRKYGAVYALRAVFEESIDGRLLKELMRPLRFEELTLLIITVMLHGWEFVDNQCGLVLLQHCGFNKLQKFRQEEVLKLFDYLQEQQIFEKLYQKKRELLGSSTPGGKEGAASELTLPFAFLNRSRPGDEDDGVGGAESTQKNQAELLNRLYVEVQSRNAVCLAHTWKSRPEESWDEPLKAAADLCALFKDKFAEPVLVTSWIKGDKLLQGLNAVLRRGGRFVIGNTHPCDVPFKALLVKNGLELSAQQGTCLKEDDAGQPVFYGRTQEVFWNCHVPGNTPGSLVKKRFKLYMHFFYAFGYADYVFTQLLQQVRRINERCCYYFMGGPIDLDDPAARSLLLDLNLIKLSAERDAFVLNMPEVRKLQSLHATQLVVSNCVSDLELAGQLYIAPDNRFKLCEGIEQHFGCDDLSLPLQLTNLCGELADELTCRFANCSDDDFEYTGGSLCATLQDLDGITAVQDVDSGLVVVQKPIPERSRQIMAALGVKM